MSVSSVIVDYFPGEDFFEKYLQHTLTLVLGKKNIKQGRLIIFKRTHFFIQLTLQNSRNNKENIEIPIPFFTEYYPDDNVVYFDYRVKTLFNSMDFDDDLNNFTLKNTQPSQYFNRILEIQAKVV
jgi:hypothetical protein